MKNLTLIITTYNRKVPLIKMLKSIENQGHYDDFKLIISNNSSDYNVEEWVKQNVSDSFFEIVEFYNRPFNIGGDLNIAFTFQLCQTKWMWLLSDDDYLSEGAIDVVLRDIYNNSEVATLKYSIVGFSPNIDYSINTIDGFLDYYLKSNQSSGEMIFMSNNVFNLEKVGKYIGYAPMSAHTYMSQMVPTFLSLMRENSKVVFKPDAIINYYFSGSSYNSSKAEAGFFNIVTFLDLNRSQAIKIKKIFKQRNQIGILIHLEKENNRYIKRLLYRKIFESFYSYFNIKDLMFWILFNICDITKLKLKKIQEFYKLVKR